MTAYQIVREEWGHDCWGAPEYCGEVEVGSPFLIYENAVSHIPNDEHTYRIREIEIIE